MTGLLTAKTDASGKAVTYTYTSANQLATRVWARRVTTSYGYDNNTGELTSISYSDGTTTNVSYAYDRLGRQTAITDAVGTRDFAYNAALALESETLGDYYGAGKRLTRQYSTGTAGTDVVGRASGFDVGTADDADADYTISYAYDAENRLNKVTDSAATHTYTYDANADRLSERASTAFALRVAYAYEENRSLLTSIANTADGALVSKYAYANDAAGRRTSVANTGSAFTQSASSLWSYNAKSEVTGQTRHAGTDLTNLGTSIADGLFSYDFDNIGNRTTSASSSFAASYTANALNQFSAIACTTPAKNLAPTYDADGNETCDGTWHYTWDGENRLTQAKTYAATPEEGCKRLTFVYDYQSRRVRKTVETYASGVWATTSDEKYLYNNWNMVCAYNNTQTVPSLAATYTWGLDIAEQNDASRSGTTEPGTAAGGVGGLLAVNKITTADATTAPVGTYAAIYDGNGNVTGLVNTSGASVAHYEYGPFGEMVATTGDAAGACPYGFSTKYADEETGLCYYGYRYYNSEWGRWINRDPIGEIGGINTYICTNNNTVCNSDSLGLFVIQGEMGAPILVRITFDLDWSEDSNCCLHISSLAEVEVGLGAGAGITFGKLVYAHVGAMLVGLGRKWSDSYVICKNGGWQVERDYPILNVSKYLSQGGGLGRDSFGAGVSIDMDIEIGASVHVIATSSFINIRAHVSGYFDLTSDFGANFGDYSIGNSSPKELKHSQFDRTLFEKTVYF
jgi:RHS repeat-associated protein